MYIILSLDSSRNTQPLTFHASGELLKYLL